ncbi:SufS family cysteine desulfurase [Halosquirtibacter laminarini]|uniref:SufS family cysteine desulfurase n=1 Tax=Halosquirtibacter laminarini TaxID=3374600 RepID=A0AC61NPG7_9BACT|nr:SufS family cysteine desulfurase [Prolixibacteraceae bacterium]
MSFDVQEFRSHFPILDQQIYPKKDLVYFDNAATTQKPCCVLDAVERYMMKVNGNIHRGTHKMAAEATVAYEAVRDQVTKILNASCREEVVFTKGTTESINLVSYSLGEIWINEGDEILVSELEHHANIVPWQMLCQRKGAVLKVIPFNEKGELKLDVFENLLSDKTKIVAVNHASNVLGTINPIEYIIGKAHEYGAYVLIDGAQGVGHCEVDVQKLDCDFYVFSGHKYYGPTGTGALYGKKEILERMPPFMTGGEMIETVTFKETTFNVLPYKFEPGTPNYTDVIGLGAALNFVDSYGKSNLVAWELELFQYAMVKLKNIEGIRFFGTSDNKVGIISFAIDGVHHFDLGTLLDQLGFAVRTGRLCADPIMDHFDVQGVTRASLAPYNTKEEVDRFYEALLRIQQMFV